MLVDLGASESGDDGVEAALRAGAFEVRVVSAAAEALEWLRTELVDVVLVRCGAAAVDGVDVVRAIRAQVGDRFLPLLFLVPEGSVSRKFPYVEAGGDDVLLLPCNPVLLTGKVGALGRLSQRARPGGRARRALRAAHAREASELAVAERIFSNIAHPGCLNGASFKYLHTPRSVFNGDVLLAAPTLSGGLRVLVGDFTGHGLAAAVGALPAADVFYGMTQKGFAIPDLLYEINRKLRRVLPVGKFLAAAFIELDDTHTNLKIWNGGIPDVLVYDGADGGLRFRHESGHVPLGAVPNAELDARVAVHECRAGDRIIAYSDGVLDAVNPAGERFGQARIEQALAGSPGCELIFESLVDAIGQFRAGRTQADDTTLVEILCDPSVCRESRPAAELAPAPIEGRRWSMSVELDAAAIRSSDPRPLLTPLVLDFQGLTRHWESIFTILTELYSNALDHGILGLDSALKSTREGFVEYYRERERRLDSLREARLRIEVEHRPLSGGGEVEFRVSDGGPGFRHEGIESRAGQERFAGRGIPLLRALCRELHFHGRGNEVSAVYQWQ